MPLHKLNLIANVTELCNVCYVSIDVTVIIE